MQNAFENAMQQLSNTKQYLNFDQSKFDFLRSPDRTIQMKVPIKMDDGS